MRNSDHNEAVHSEEFINLSSSIQLVISAKNVVCSSLSVAK